MPAKLKKVLKIHKSDDAVVRAIHTEYFLKLGRTWGRVSPYGGPAWRADFGIKFGRPDYRKRAWQDVREDVKGKMPSKLFRKLDSHFTTGSGERFLEAFSHEEREGMYKAMEDGE